jgi:hypothetical protein
MSDLIAIASCGRSGTKWLVRELGRSAAISTSGEVKPLFHWILAYCHGMRHAWRYVRDGYRELAAAHDTPLHLNKCSPVLWLADRLLQELPSMRFLALVRDPYAVVSSSLGHDGIRARLQNAPSDGWPNLAVGVRGPPDLAAMTRLGLAGRAAWKWCAVRREQERLADLHPDRVRIVRFEDAILAPETTAAALSDWLGVKIPPPMGNPDVIDKWHRREDAGDLFDEVPSVLNDCVGRYLPPAP